MKALAPVLALVVLAWGCAPTRGPAPVEDRRPARVVTPAAKPPAAKAPTTGGAPVATAEAFYTVKRGDTLYSIALEHGADYREVAQWNSLEDPSKLSVGQVLRVTAPAQQQGVQVGTAPGGAGRVESRPLGAGPQPPQPPQQQKPAVAAREEPRLLEAQPLQFVWPAKGKVLAGFAEPRRKGIDIDGKPGDPVTAAAAGRVTYVGSGIPGLGKLVVIRHDQGFITVYAHNKDIVVKEQQSVTRGQKIAELGSSDSDRPKLHFQIRKGAAAVDPLLYLPKS
ncbi:MAG TPA: peptidoglycan DD-metalloendopeptidase family protein [Burkholderiales bacterium]|nr:peptidoglycan DD-metalloendopeptidase family protein [Burkholderiales bacterium]